MANPLIPTGVSCKLNLTSLTSPGPLVFAFQPKPCGGDFSAVFQVVGTVSTLTSSLQNSLDGGVTWTDYIVAANFLSAAAGSKTITPLVAGALYRINPTVLTGSQDFWVVAN